jgi:predicted ribosomally synthesized peptide with nif11-like leader
MASIAEDFGKALMASPDLQAKVASANTADEVAKVAQANGYDVTGQDLVNLHNETSRQSLSDAQLKSAGAANFNWNEKVSDSWGTTVACSCY